VLATTFASKRWSIPSAISITAALVLLATAIFIYGLGLPISLFGPWVGGY
jgi:hypothetical protein